MIENLYISIKPLTSPIATILYNEPGSSFNKKDFNIHCLSIPKFKRLQHWRLGMDNN